MDTLKTSYFIGILLSMLILLGAASISLLDSYFHTKEINALITGCYENGGEVILEIHNNVTSSYSFECKAK